MIHMEFGRLSKKADAIMAAALGRKDSAQTLFLKLVDVTQEMAKRIEMLEKGLVEANRHCKAMHTIGCGPQRSVDDDQG